MGAANTILRGGQQARRVVLRFLVDEPRVARNVHVHRRFRFSFALLCVQSSKVGMIIAAGFPQLAERVDEGKQLNAPCRVVTKPSEDGKYVNVKQVLPVEQPRPQQRGWS
jgi:hypothetical protein